MAKNRILNTRFWNDSFVSNLKPIEKLFFVYLVTNEHTNICGIYELPLKIAAIESGIDELTLKKCFVKLKGKFYYVDGWVIAVNFPKYQASNMPKVQKGVEIALGLIPKDILDKAIQYGYPIHTHAMYSNSNSNSNSNITEGKGIEIPEIIKAFEKINPACKRMYGNTTQRKACQHLIEVYGFDKTRDVVERLLPQTNGMEFFPSISTPLKLQEKWSDLESAIKRHVSKTKNEKNKNGNVYW